MDNLKTAIVTGSTGGIGAEVAHCLAREGWSLILLNRSQTKTATQMSELQAAYPNITMTFVQVDLLDVSDIARAVAEIAQTHQRIDALYNISGVLTSERKLSAQGYESHYAVNVLANYALIEGLRPLLKRAPDDTLTMVVTMSSSAVNSPKALDIARLPNPEKIGGLMGAYAATKLALTAMSAALAEPLRENGILIRAIDPGATITPMTSMGDGMPKILQWLAPLLFAKPDKQARKIVSAADPAALRGRSGIFVAAGKEKRMPKIAADTNIQRALLAQLQSDLSATP